MKEFLEKLKGLLEGVDGVDMQAIEAELTGLVGTEGEKTALQAKNQQLITEKRTLQSKIKDLEAQIAGFDKDEYERLKEEETARLADPENKGNKVDIEGIKAKVEQKWKVQLEAKQKELDDLKKSAEEKESAIQNMLIEAEIEKQFVTGKKVMDAHRGLLKDAFKAKAYVEFDGEERVIYMKDKGQDMPISDYFEYWKNLADSKVYLEGDVPTGSGATGSKGGFKKQKAYKDMTPKERVEFYQTYGEEAYRNLKNAK